MVKGGLPRGTLEDPPAEGTPGLPGRPSTSHVVHGGYPPGFGMNNPGSDFKGDHQHKRHRPAGDTEYGG